MGGTFRDVDEGNYSSSQPVYVGKQRVGGISRDAVEGSSSRSQYVYVGKEQWAVFYRDVVDTVQVVLFCTCIQIDRPRPTP